MSMRKSLHKVCALIFAMLVIPLISAAYAQSTETSTWADSRYWFVHTDGISNALRAVRKNGGQIRVRNKKKHRTFFPKNDD